MDLLDVVFRTERTFAIDLPTQAVGVAIAARQPPDLVVADLIQLVRERLPPGWFVGPIVDQDVLCVICGYNLRGLDRSGNCPECGTAASVDGQLFAGVLEVLVDALGVSPDEVTPASRLRADLGCRG